MKSRFITWLSRFEIILFVYCCLMAVLLGLSLNTLFFVLGVVLGWLLLLLDESVFVQHYQDRPVEGFAVNSSEEDLTNQPFLATRSTLFLLVLAPLAFFVISSTSSMLGKGLVMGMILTLLVEMIKHRSCVDRFNNRFWSMVKTKLTSQQAIYIILGATIFFVLLNFWLLLRLR